MSIKVMTLLWDRYPEGGSELLLALALADIGHDDGRSIYPGVPFMAAKTRMSERNVQYLLAKMIERKLLVLVRKGGIFNGRNFTTKYRIDVDLLRTLPPIDDRVQSLHHPSESEDNPVDKSVGVVQPSVGGGAKEREKVVKPVAPKPSLTIKNQEGGNNPPQSQTPTTPANACQRCNGAMGDRTLTLNKWVCQVCREDYMAGKWGQTAEVT